MRKCVRFCDCFRTTDSTSVVYERNARNRKRSTNKCLHDYTEKAELINKKKSVCNIKQPNELFLTSKMNETGRW